MSSRRKAYHAGSWYSADGVYLSGELEGWLSQASSLHSPARAIIAPHAGYSYCGACSGHAYKQVDPTSVKRVFVLGPSHHVYMSGCSLSSCTHYQTPLYDMEIDQKIYSELKATGKFEIMSQHVDEEEHSIEMHLPYIAKIMEEKKTAFTIVPVLVGATRGHKESEYGKIFSSYLADPENLFVISSDFCHWGKRFRFTSYDKSKGAIYASIEALDRTGMDCISSLSTSAFNQYLDATQNTICGRHPISVLLNAVEHLKSSRSDLTFSLKFVQYAQSSKCKSMSDSSVSYASAALTISNSN